MSKQSHANKEKVSLLTDIIRHPINAQHTANRSLQIKLHAIIIGQYPFMPLI